MKKWCDERNKKKDQILKQNLSLIGQDHLYAKGQYLPPIPEIDLFMEGKLSKNPPHPRLRRRHQGTRAPIKKVTKKHFKSLIPRNDN